MFYHNASSFLAELKFPVQINCLKLIAQKIYRRELNPYLLTTQLCCRYTTANLWKEWELNPPHGFCKNPSPPWYMPSLGGIDFVLFHMDNQTRTTP